VIHLENLSPPIAIFSLICCVVIMVFKTRVWTNFNAQPHALMNEIKGRLDENWEYVDYDLVYKEFKA
jgi:hypothetical protein